MRKLMVVASIAVAQLGCKSENKTVASNPIGSGSAATPPVEPAKPVEVAKPTETPTPPAPVQGTVVQLAGVGADKTLEITLPAGLKATVTEMEEEKLPTAEIAGNGMKFVIEQPEAGQFKLAEEQGMIQRSDAKVTFDVAVEEPDGWTLVYKHGPGTDKNSPEFGKYVGLVSRKSLGVNCGAYEAADRKQADDIVAICRTLKVATKPK